MNTQTVSELFGTAWSIVSARIGMFALAALVYFIAILLLGSVTMILELLGVAPSLLFMFDIATTIATVLLGGMVTWATLQIVRGVKPSWDILHISQHKLLTFLAFTVLMMLVGFALVAIHVIVFGIPLFLLWDSIGLVGSILWAVVAFLSLFMSLIYVNTRLMFAPFLVLDEKAGAVQALKVSWKQTSERVWWLLSVYILCGLVFLCGLLALGVGLLVAFPVVVITYALLYEKIGNPQTVVAHE